MGFPNSLCNYLQFKTPVVLLSAAAMLLVIFSAFLGYGFLPILLIITSTAALILSTLLFTFSSSDDHKPRHHQLESPELVPQNQSTSPDYHPEKAHHDQVPHENITKETETQEQKGGESEADTTGLIAIGHERNLVATRSSPPVPVFLSGSDESQQVGRSSSSTEDSEVMEWMLQDKICGSPDWSDDGSISDDDDDQESLFEIALGPPIEERPHSCRFNKQALIHTKFPDIFFKQQYGLMELYLAELNHEEDNLIEIDISMGSIKCPTRFQIQA